MREQIQPDRVAIYIRWSTEDQGEGTTLAVQSEACRHYLLSQGWQARDDLTYIDDGYSGGSLDRPALTRLRQAVQAGRVDCVVVFRLDRLSRSVIDTVTLVLQEWADLTHVKSAREPVDTTTAMGRQFFYMLVSYAEWERNVIRERMFSGKLRRAREGRSPGMPAPYGYTRGPTPGTLVLVPEEAEAVRTAFGLAATGLSARQIAARLQGHGHPTRGGGRWTASTISRLLRNPIYAGRLVWGRRRLNPRHGKAPGEPRLKTAAEPHVSVAATTVPALVSPEEFDRVQQALTGRRLVAPGAAGSPRLLTGLLRCGACGGPMQYNAYRQWAYYRCGDKASGPGGCRAPAVPAEPLEAQVEAQVRQRFAPLALQEAARRRAEAEQQATARRGEATAALAAARRRLEQQERRINRDYRHGRIDAATRQQLLAEAAAEAGALARREAQQQQRLDMEEPPTDPWEALSPLQRKELLRQFLQEVRAQRDPAGQIIADLLWRSSETGR